MTFSVLFTFTDFQLIYVLTRGGPLNATHLMATLSFQRAISGGAAGRGRGDRDAMVPFLLAPSCSATSACSAASGSRAGKTEPRQGE
jgi:ABC-type sugar transport system permease subunit